MIKRSGYGYLSDSEKEDHSCALLCPACPQPGINLPEHWEKAPADIMYTFLIHQLDFIYLMLAGFMSFSWLWMQIFE